MLSHSTIAFKNVAKFFLYLQFECSTIVSFSRFQARKLPDKIEQLEKVSFNKNEGGMSLSKGPLAARGLHGLKDVQGYGLRGTKGEGGYWVGCGCLKVPTGLK